MNSHSRALNAGAVLVLLVFPLCSGGCSEQKPPADPLVLPTERVLEVDPLDAPLLEKP